MIIIFGTGLYGKADQVPGLFYVATRFFHLYYVPLIPVGSYVVFEGTEQGENFSGCSVGLSIKSILSAWLRLAMLGGGITLAVLMVLGVIQCLEGRGNWLHYLGMGLGSAVLFYALKITYQITRAGPVRALVLARQAGVAPEVLAQYFVDYDGIDQSLPADEPAPADEPQAAPEQKEDWMTR